MQTHYKTFLFQAVFLILFSCCARKDDISNTFVYITHTGNKYHINSCPYLGKSAIALSLAEAAERGYKPCGECNPPYIDAGNRQQDTIVQKKSAKHKKVKKQQIAKVQCSAFTAKGARCKRTTDDSSGKCWQHR